MIQLQAEQTEALSELQRACQEVGTQAVIIGAMAYRIWVRDQYRTTEDLDLAVALDLEELSNLTDRLEARGWLQNPKREHRWITQKGARVDLLPAGEKARRQKQLTWPVAETTMSLVGFDHVFADAIEVEIAPGLQARVVPLPVLVLLKIVSFLDDPARREQDLRDVGSVMRLYESEGDRRFSDEVFAAGIDYESAGAYLLGLDLSRLCTEPDEVPVVERFLAQLSNEDSQILSVLARSGRPWLDENEQQVRTQAAALVTGFQVGRIA
jgi:predicted nucleotidyltransferase